VTSYPRPKRWDVDTEHEGCGCFVLFLGFILFGICGTLGFLGFLAYDLVHYFTR
jgi:hypothetical protein